MDLTCSDLHEQGWAAPAWPVEFGGCDWTLTQHYIFSCCNIIARFATRITHGPVFA